jgi:hypothetical protein
MGRGIFLFIYENAAFLGAFCRNVCILMGSRSAFAEKAALFCTFLQVLGDRGASFCGFLHCFAAIGHCFKGI